MKLSEETTPAQKHSAQKKRNAHIPSLYVSSEGRRGIGVYSCETKMDMNAALQNLQEELEPLERLVRLFSASLDQPKLVATGDGRSYRYQHPDILHFCLLKAAVALTTLNAAIELARLGYIFQVNALIRVVVECTTHLEFVVDPSRNAEHVEKVEEYIKAIFRRLRQRSVGAVSKAADKAGNGECDDWEDIG
jgi:hypothetical protein